jgi:hypothetical protein
MASFTLTAVIEADRALAITGLDPSVQTFDALVSDDPRLKVMTPWAQWGEGLLMGTTVHVVRGKWL